MGSSWHSYPSIYNLGHRALKDLLKGPVLIEEKIDGSQINFGRFGDEVRIKSKRVDIFPETAGMFSNAVATIHALANNLTEGWTYRGEYLQKPKHNGLAYDRVPAHNIILFDINTDEECYLTPEEKAAEASRLGLEVVPAYLFGETKLDEATLREFLERTSVLGGQKIEGVVIKNYDQFDMSKKVLMGKHVSEAFREIQRGAWGKANPTKSDHISEVAARVGNPARWNKAILHLREAGQITDSPKDIGPLMKESLADIKKECTEEIKDALFTAFWPQISRMATSKIPQYYKDLLLSKQFQEGGE